MKKIVEAEPRDDYRLWVRFVDGVEGEVFVRPRRRAARLTGCSVTFAPEEVVSRDPEVLGSDLVFAGTRVTVRIVLDYLKRGSILEGVHENCPTVDCEQVGALLELGLQTLERAGRG